MAAEAVLHHREVFLGQGPSSLVHIGMAAEADLIACPFFQVAFV